MKPRHPLAMMAVMISEELRAERVFAELTKCLQEAEDALADISTIDQDEVSLDDILDGASA